MRFDLENKILQIKHDLKNKILQIKPDLNEIAGTKCSKKSIEY